MKILTTIENDDGEVVFEASNRSVEGAVDELYRFERRVLPAIGGVMPETIIPF